LIGKSGEKNGFEFNLLNSKPKLQISNKKKNNNFQNSNFKQKEKYQITKYKNKENSKAKLIK